MRRVDDRRDALLLARARREARMRERRRMQVTPRLGPDFIGAIVLLILGVVLPFVSALADPRVPSNTAGQIAQEPGTIEIVPTADVLEPTLVPAPQPTIAGNGPLPTLPAITNTPVPQDLDSVPPAVGPPQELVPLAGIPPILMYHYVRTVDGAVDPLGYELSIAPELFEQHMAWLAQNGYTGIRVELLVRCIRGEALCPPKPVAITFDDGYSDAYDMALPILQRYGFSATFYIISGAVGQPGYMNWEQLAVLRDTGMEIGSHTISHPDLTQLDVGELARQVTQSKQDLERALGITITSFCYPTGLYNATVEEQVRVAGYSNAMTTRWDNDYSNALALPRRRVAGGTTADELGWIVTGG